MLFADEVDEVAEREVDVAEVEPQVGGSEPRGDQGHDDAGANRTRPGESCQQLSQRAQERGD